MTKEQKFYKTLKDIFIGAEIEGESGFVNLMRIKKWLLWNREVRKLKDTNKDLPEII